MSESMRPEGDGPPPPPQASSWAPSGTTAVPPPVPPELLVQPPPYVPPTLPERPPTFATNDEIDALTAAHALPLDISTGPSFGGFWRRAWARAITLLAASVMIAIGNAALLAATLWLHDNLPSNDCVTDRNGHRSCEPRTIILILGLAAAWVFGIAVVHMMWTRRLTTSGATLGQQQMGLAARAGSSRHRISQWQAVRRNIIGGLPLAFACGFGWFFLFEPEQSARKAVLVIEAVLVLIAFVGSLWTLADDRKRAIWDRWADTIVLEERESSWLAVGALLAGLLVPLAVAITVAATGISELHRRYDNLVDGSGSTGRTLVALIPVAAASLVAIILGHVAVRATEWGGRRPAGRGLARAGMLLGYSVPVVVVLALVSSFVHDRVEAHNARSCQETREELVTAVASFAALNGELPTNIDDLGSGIYLNNADLGQTWTIKTSATAPFYTLVGKGDCAGE